MYFDIHVFYTYLPEYGINDDTDLVSGPAHQFLKVLQQVDKTVVLYSFA